MISSAATRPVLRASVAWRDDALPGGRMPTCLTKRNDTQ